MISLDKSSPFRLHFSPAIIQAVDSDPERSGGADSVTVSESWERTGNVEGAFAELTSLMATGDAELVAEIDKFFDEYPVIAAVRHVENESTSDSLALKFIPLLEVSDNFRAFVTALRARQRKQCALA